MRTAFPSHGAWRRGTVRGADHGAADGSASTGVTLKTIAFVSQKGGSGKSTLCINLAVAAAQGGSAVAIVELDRQGTIRHWADVRGAEPPEVAPAEASEIGTALAQLAGRGHDYAFIDTPGAIGTEMLAAIRAADLCVVPSRPTPADLRAVRATLGAIYRLEKRFTFVLNQTQVSSYRTRDAARSLTALGVLPDVNIVMRTDHQDAVGAGQGVTELNPYGKAAYEIHQLWTWIARQAAGVVERRVERRAIAQPEYVRAA
jgi:chromosome partitioning protein